MSDPSDITRFTSKRPVFQAPKNAVALEAMAPRLKDNSPAPSVKTRAEASGNFDVAALIAASHMLVKRNAKVIDQGYNPRQSRTVPTQSLKVAKETAPKFQPSDVVDNATFIRKTRALDTHSPEAQALFWANGGEHYMVAGLTFAQAFDNMRREMMLHLSNIRKESVRL